MNEDLLRQGALRLGVEIDAAAVQRFAWYEKLLQQWGERMNLTAIRDPQQVVTHHFLDSVALVPVIPPDARSLVDVGSGSGFPGVVCAMLLPGLQVTLVERVQKKAAFLMAIRRELAPNAQVLACDLREVPSGAFDVAVSRAAFLLTDWIECGARLVAANGLLLAMMTARQQAPEAPDGFSWEVDRKYDVGAGPRRLLGWRRRTAA